MSSKIILITGGSRSGKSTFAEKIYCDTDDVAYIATAIVTDEEMNERIQMHQKSRNSNWKTIEAYNDLYLLIPTIVQKNILLDCVTVMITNLIFDSGVDIEQLSNEDIITLEKDITYQFEQLVQASRYHNKKLVLVTNEVGYGLVPEYKLGRIFRDIAGRINQRLATWSDEVYIVACGLPLQLK